MKIRTMMMTPRLQDKSSGDSFSTYQKINWKVTKFMRLGKSGFSSRQIQFVCSLALAATRPVRLTGLCEVLSLHQRLMECLACTKCLLVGVDCLAGLHGILQQTAMTIEDVASIGRPGPPKTYPGAKNIGLFAIRLPESFTLEFDSISALTSVLISHNAAHAERDAAPMKLPSFLLPALLDPSGHSATSLVDSKDEGDSQIATKGVPMRLSLNADDVALMAKECIVRFDLNYDQASVLKHVARWFVSAAVQVAMRWKIGYLRMMR